MQAFKPVVLDVDNKNSKYLHMMNKARRIWKRKNKKSKGKERKENALR